MAGNTFNRELDSYLEGRSSPYCKVHSRNLKERVQCHFSLLIDRIKKLLTQAKQFFSPIDISDLRIPHDRATVVEAYISPAQKWFHDLKNKIKDMNKEKREQPPDIDPEIVEQQIKEHHR